MMTNEPSTFRAGDSVAWSRSLPEFLPADGWVLKYRLLYASGAAVPITSSASGADHAVSLTSADTASWTAGTATLVAYVEKGSDRVTLESQQVAILPDLTAAANFDSRTQNQKALADLEAALATYCKAGQGHVAEYDIAGRRMKFRTSAEIIELIDYYKRAVAKERAALAAISGGAPGRVFYRG
jgi:hypothetical protein